MTAPCPHCDASHDLAGRVTGDELYCRHCGAWFRVVFVAGGVRLEACDAPAGWPKERRKAKAR